MLRRILSFPMLIWLSSTAVHPTAALAEGAPGQSIDIVGQAAPLLPVVIDTDMAPDDWMAILFLLQRKDVNVKAISVTGAGETHCGPGIRHARGLVALAGAGRLPVACGSERPLQVDHVFPAQWRQAVNNLYGLTLPETPADQSSQTAVDLLTTSILSSPQKVTLITLGPLTNVAEALRRKPRLAENVKMLYIMGGAVDVPGNVGSSDVRIDNKTAEWNIYVDPHAAEIVLGSGVPITLVPLNATNHALLTPSFYERLKDNHTTPEARFVFDLLTKNYAFVQSGSYCFWDPLAAAILLDDSLAEFRSMGIDVVTEEGQNSGQTRRVNSGPVVRVAVWADGTRFEQMFLSTLNGVGAESLPIERDF